MICAAPEAQWIRLASFCSTMSSTRIGPRSARRFISFLPSTRSGGLSAGLMAEQSFVEKELPRSFARAIAPKNPVGKGLMKSGILC